MSLDKIARLWYTICSGRKPKENNLIRREIDGVWYFCHDTNESEKERAEQNRKMIEEKSNSDFWSQMERYLAQHPRSKLPKWIPSVKE